MLTATVRKVTMGVDEIQMLAEIVDMCPNYWDNKSSEAMQGIINQINERIGPLLDRIDQYCKAQTEEQVLRQFVQALESGLRDHPTALSKAHNLCEMYRRRYKTENIVYEFGRDRSVFFAGLDSYIGPPLASVFQAMQREHENRNRFEYYAPIDQFPARDARKSTTKHACRHAQANGPGEGGRAGATRAPARERNRVFWCRCGKKWICGDVRGKATTRY